MLTGWKKQTDDASKSDPRRREAPTPAKQDEKEPVQTVFIPRTPLRQLDDLIVSATTRRRIETALNRLRFHDVLYHQWNLKAIDPYGMRTAINLFGPPGTGKTFCAEAIGQYLNRPIIDVNYAEIESKYVGDTSKNIVEAFNCARNSGAVLFFDEADSILGKRMTNVTQSADHSVNVSRAVMLKQLDAFDGVVIFATNLAQNYDSAFVRRILAHIEFELPDKECLHRLWKRLLIKELPVEPELSEEWLAEQSAGLSGGDLLNVVIAAASRAVEREVERQSITRSDILEEILFVRNAKLKVGNVYVEQGQGRITTTVTTCSAEEIPLEGKERYESIIAQPL